MNDQESLSLVRNKPYQSRKSIRNNPIFVKEVRGLIRQQRSRSVLTFYLIILVVVTFLFYVTVISANTINPDPDVRRTLGKIIFLAITLAQLLAIMFVAPLFSADSITSERENKTFDLLHITSLTTGSIVRGKLLAGVMFTLMFLLSSLPLQSSAYLLGGLTPSEFFVSIVLLISTTVFLCSFSIWASTRSRRTSSAMGLVYSIVSIIFIGFPTLAYVIIKLTPIPFDQDLFVSLQSISKPLDPIFQIIFIILVWLLIASNPIFAAFVSYNLYLDEGAHILYNLTAFNAPFPLIAPWIAFVILYLFISWLFYRLSIRQIKQTNKL
jgi:ABC-type transport system involved in multi-copper enzyme maturation permease subunit